MAWKTWKWRPFIALTQWGDITIVAPQPPQLFVDYCSPFTLSDGNKIKPSDAFLFDSRPTLQPLRVLSLCLKPSKISALCPIFQQSLERNATTSCQVIPRPTALVGQSTFPPSNVPFRSFRVAHLVGQPSHGTTYSR